MRWILPMPCAFGKVGETEGPSSQVVGKQASTSVIDSQEADTVHLVVVQGAAKGIQRVKACGM